MGSSLYVNVSHTTFLHESGLEKTIMNHMESGTVMEKVCLYARCNTA